MEIILEQGDLFSVSDEYFLAHCISADCALGAGIAVKFEQKFKLRRKLLMLNKQIGKLSINNLIVGNSVLIGKVFNLITKEKYWHKPTYRDLELSLRHMAGYVDELEIKKITMPKIGCGLDGLSWPAVESILGVVFSDLPGEILVKYL